MSHSPFITYSVCDREGNGTAFQSSCLENPMDGGAWWAAAHGVAKSGTWLSDFTFTFHFHALEKETATHFIVFAWRTPGMREPGGLPSMGSHRVGHDWNDLAAAVEFAKTLGNSEEQGSLVYCSLWVLTEFFSRVIFNNSSQSKTLSLGQ